jgi:tetratricopeptide (TPR) repeat protein
VTGDVLVSFTLSGKPAVHTAHEASANGSYSVTITLPPPDHRGEHDAEVAIRFDIPWEACTRGVIAQATDESTANACKKAAAIADEFPKDRRFSERRMAYVYAATAYGNIRDFETALQYADKAVETALEHADNSGSAAAYSIRAKIRAFSGDMEGGNKDISAAEDFCRNGGLSAALKLNLEFHAELLKCMNRPQEATAKLEEAARL